MKGKYLEFVKAFLEEFRKGSFPQRVDEYYHQEAIQCEFPNLLTKELTERNLQTLKEAAEKGRKVLKRESYELVNYYETGDTVIIEAIWTGVLSVPIGKLNTGDEMKAYFAQFYEFKDNKIYRQRNYDCFESFMQ